MITIRSIAEVNEYLFNMQKSYFVITMTLATYLILIPFLPILFISQEYFGGMVAII